MLQLRDPRRQPARLAKEERAIVEGEGADGDKYARLMLNNKAKREVLQEFSRAYDEAIRETVGARKP